MPESRLERNRRSYERWYCGVTEATGDFDIFDAIKGYTVFSRSADGMTLTVTRDAQQRLIVNERAPMK